MSIRRVLLSGAFAAAVLGATSLSGCGSFTDSLFGDGKSDDPPPPGSSGGLFGSEDAGSGGGGGDGGDKPCTNLCQRQVRCPGTQQTTLTGKVYDPAGKVPLYNVLVYVPNAPVSPIATGASCDRCGNVSGDPLVSAITDPAGVFKLENVPIGKDVPLVVQVGKWRRQIVIPNVPQCVSTALPDTTVRLPRNKGEGDLPQMAIASGEADPFECLLVKMGIDTAEFTHESRNGRVHYFVENGIDTQGTNAPRASTLYNDLAKMKKYDIIFLPCEGSERNKPDAADKNLVDYTAVGGRVFTTHYGYHWLHLGAAPFPSTGVWNPEQSDRYEQKLPVTINQSFPKGAAFAQWLVNVKASASLGTMDLIESRHDLDSAPDPPSTTWMTTSAMPAPKSNATMHITFNTPIGTAEDQQCGRVVYSDFHVSADAADARRRFPASCRPGDLTAQEKALEFMLFDLSSCIQSDKLPPGPPPVVK